MNSQNRGGYAALTLTLLTVASSLAIIGGFTFFALQEVKANRAFVKSLSSRAAAEGGIEDAAWRILAGREIDASETVSTGGATTTVTVTALGSKRIVRAEGVRDNFQRNLETEIELPVTDIGFVYGVQVGDDGLELKQNATISGSVYSNGDIKGDNGASITGDAFAAGTSKIEEVSVVGNAQAYLIDDSTVGKTASSTTKLDDVVVGKDAHANELDDTTITRDAYYQIIDAQSVVLGVKYPGNPGPAPLPKLSMPIADSVIEQWKAEAQVLGTISSGSCSQTWSPPANPYTVNGGVIERKLALNNNQILILKGTVWVKCGVDISNGAAIKLDSSYGTNSGVLIADGAMHMQNNGVFQGSGLPGSYLMLLTTATGGGHHGSAIDLHNNAAGAIFYAQNGMIWLHNNVTASQLTAKKIHLENNATVIYEIGLQDARFSSGPAGGYDMKYWREVE